MWEIELNHKRLNKRRLIRGSNKYIVAQKAALQCIVWRRMWYKKLEREDKVSRKQLRNGNMFQPLINSLKRELKELDIVFEPDKQVLEAFNKVLRAMKEGGSYKRHLLEVDDGLDVDEEITGLPDERFEGMKANKDSIRESLLDPGTIESILKQALLKNQVVDWEGLKDSSEFPGPRPQTPSVSAMQSATTETDPLHRSEKDKSKFSRPKPQPPKLLTVPEPPSETDPRYQPKIESLDNIFFLRKQNKIDEARILFRNEYDQWLNLKEDILKKNAELTDRYRNELKEWVELENQDQKELKKREVEEREFLERRKEKKRMIQSRRGKNNILKGYQKL